jgi:hypothetical protein
MFANARTYRGPHTSLPRITLSFAPPSGLCADSCIHFFSFIVTTIASVLVLRCVRWSQRSGPLKAYWQSCRAQAEFCLSSVSAHAAPEIARFSVRRARTH